MAQFNDDKKKMGGMNRESGNKAAHGPQDKNVAPKAHDASEKMGSSYGEKNADKSATSHSDKSASYDKNDKSSK